MNILLITDSYPPEIRSASYLMEELAKELKSYGYNVFVITTYPRYNLTNNKIIKSIEEICSENGINVLRIKTLPHHKVNFVIRGISQLMMPYLFFKKIKKYLHKVDSIIIYSPPLPLSIVGEKVKKKYSAKFILNVQDIFPQNAIDLGVLKNKILIKYFKKMESEAYKNADIILTHSVGNMEFLRKEYSEYSNKIRVLHNWVNIEEFKYVKKSNFFRKELRIENKFILLFAGVLGPSQGLDFIIKLAERMVVYKDICFLFAGDGMEKKKLVNIVKEKKLDNVIFMPFVSKKEYPLLLSEVDVGLVSLTSKNKTPVVPGKLLGYMAAGKPVLAFLNSQSDGHKIIEDSKCGYSSFWGDIDSAVENLLMLYENRQLLLSMGENGRKYVMKYFNKEKIVKELIKMLKK